MEPEIIALLEQCPQRRKFNPKLVICPRCDQVGRAGQYHPTRDKNKNVTYFVVHHKIDGTWGKSNLQKRKRCYMRNGHENDIFVAKMKQKR